MSEQVWIDRVAGRRDAAAFEALYDRHADRLYGFVLRLAGGDRDLADDVFQDTWVVAITRLAEFERRSRFSTWLAGIAYNRLRRRVGVRQPSELASDPIAPAPAADGGGDVASALSRLPDGYRAVLVLHAEGYTHAEIGDLLGITDGASKSQLSRARRAARQLLGDDHER